MAHFFTISLRRLAKDRFYAAISVASLALGISCALVISLYLISELTYDHHHENHERIYRVSTHFSDLKIVNSGYEIGPMLAAENPQFENYLRTFSAYEKEFEFGDLKRSWEDVYFVDASIFDIFTFNIVQGSPETLFSDPFSIAVSESFAEYYFPNEDPMGKQLTTEEFAFRVRMIYEDFPENLTRTYSALLPFELLEIYKKESRLQSNQKYVTADNYTYILAPPTFNPELITEASASIVEKTIGAEMEDQSFGLSHSLVPLDRIHFDKSEIGPIGERGNITNVYSFAALAIILLLTSCINYVNLATARTSLRSQEVSLRKILGANKRVLISQFLTESVILTALSFIIAFTLCIALLKLNFIEEFTGKAELVEILFQPAVLLSVVLGGFMVSLLAGIYPAYNLARQSMLQGMKPIQLGWRRAISLRRILVLTQLAVSVGILACVFIMNSQLNFIDTSYLGFKKENQLIVRLQSADLIIDVPAIRTELLKHPNITAVSNMQRVPGTGYAVTVGPVQSNSGEMLTKNFNSLAIGAHFFDTMQIEILQGRSDALQNPDSRPVWVNQAFVKDLGWDQPIGKTVSGNEVVGVTTDFNFVPMYESVAPLVMTQFTSSDYEGLPEARRESVATDMIVTTNGENIIDTRRHLDAVLSQFINEALPEYRSMSSLWIEAYSNDKKTLQLASVFAAVSVLISLLGLSGLASFTAHQKSKEIAVRKILGSSVTQVTFLLAKDLTLLLIIAIIPAVLLSYLAINIWLERFAYQIDIGPTAFIFSIAIVAAVSIGNLVLLVYKTANANPAYSLRQE